jgi:ferrochelatase
MTPRQYLKTYKYDTRLVTGGYYPAEPLPVGPGDTVGVVLFHLGGPDAVANVRPFLYNVFMDPVLLDLPGGKRMRPWFSRLMASLFAKSVRQEYGAIGGASPINRLAEEQAQSLEALLNSRYGQATGVAFRTYVAMRYWHPLSEEAARQMHQDGIDKVVLLPLFPQYSKTTTGSALAYWWRLEQEGEIPRRPTTRVTEYAAHPKFIQALSERIDEALQRFPRRHREGVPLLFSAHGTRLKEMQERGDAYCCLVHTTVDRVMTCRGQDRPFHVAFHGKIGPTAWLAPRTVDVLKILAGQEHTSVLVVPVALVLEHVETTYALDIELREQASKAGLSHFEVMPALNCHPLLIEALAEATLAQLAFPARSKTINGAATPLPFLTLDHRLQYDPSERCLRCAKCRYGIEAQRWTAVDVSQKTRTAR